MEQCPSCNKQVCALKLVIGIVTLQSFKCSSCGRSWRHATLNESFSYSSCVHEVERLRARHPGSKPSHVAYVLHYLEAKLTNYNAGSVESSRAFRKRRDDEWERRYLGELLGEDY